MRKLFPISKFIMPQTGHQIILSHISQTGNQIILSQISHTTNHFTNVVEKALF